MPKRASALVPLLAIAAIALAVNLWAGASRSSATGGPGIISVGYDHTCALLDSGAVQCFGSNAFGQLGEGTTLNSSVPVDVCSRDGCGELLGDVRSVSSGREHTCVLTNAGGVQCWGANTLMQLGNGTDVSSSLPGEVDGLSSGVAYLSSGRYFNCVVTTSGGAKCWGTNFYGQLGDGTNTARGAPVDVVGLTSGVAGIETERYHACAVMIGGTLKCWGDNVDGQLGNPGVTATNQPVDVCADNECSTPLQNVLAVSLGLHSTCVLTTNGGVKCWGKNDFGQLGTGNTTSSAAPADVFGLASGVGAISVGEANVCARLATGVSAVKCWGDNRFGQLGNGTTTDSSYPSELCADATCSGPLSSAAAISTGSHQACAALTAGGVKCWGLNTSGQLGDGTTTQRSAPVDTLLSNVKPAPTPTSTNTPANTPTPTRSPSPTSTPTPAPLTGDANCDDAINSIDAALILQYGAGLLSTVDCPVGADANNDDQINALDAALVLQYVAGLLDEL